MQEDDPRGGANGHLNVEGIGVACMRVPGRETGVMGTELDKLCGCFPLAPATHLPCTGPGWPNRH